MRTLRLLLPILSFGLLAGPSAIAWDYEGHRVVNQIALASLPTHFPAFVRDAAAAERVAFLSGEPDRWRNTPELSLQHANNPDHYIDLDELIQYQLKPESLPMFRYDFVEELARYRAAHPAKFPPLDPTKNADHTRRLVGLLPWTITEVYAKLKSEFSYLKAFEENVATPEEIANARQNILYTMGVMGHFVGDAAQPLHTTVHHHGWIGDNPNGYTTNRAFHQWIDGGFFEKSGGISLKEVAVRVRPARGLRAGDRPVRTNEMFALVLDYIGQSHQLVEPLYRLDKAGKLTPVAAGEAEGRAFLTGQLLVGGQMLGDLWLTAWEQAHPDKYLQDKLSKRMQKQSPAAVPAKSP